MAWEEEFDDIPHYGTDQAKLAWRNWVDLNRFVHPGLLVTIPISSNNPLTTHPHRIA